MSDEQNATLVTTSPGLQTFSGDLDSAFEPNEHRERTASFLAKALIWILGGSVALYFFLLAVLAACSAVESTKQLTAAFTAWLPVISGLVGGAITYYFTREANS